MLATVPPVTLPLASWLKPLPAIVNTEAPAVSVTSVGEKLFTSARRRPRKGARPLSKLPLSTSSRAILGSPPGVVLGRGRAAAAVHPGLSPAGRPATTEGGGCEAHSRSTSLTFSPGRTGRRAVSFRTANQAAPFGIAIRAARLASLSPGRTVWMRMR
jgi:hypothetical protein